MDKRKYIAEIESMTMKDRFFEKDRLLGKIKERNIEIEKIEEKMSPLLDSRYDLEKRLEILYTYLRG